MQVGNDDDAAAAFPVIANGAEQVGERDAGQGGGTGAVFLAPLAGGMNKIKRQFVEQDQRGTVLEGIAPLGLGRGTVSGERNA